MEREGPISFMRLSPHSSPLIPNLSPGCQCWLCVPQIGEYRMLIILTTAGLLLNFSIAFFMTEFDIESSVSKHCTYWTKNDIDLIQEFRVSVSLYNYLCCLYELLSENYKLCPKVCLLKTLNKMSLFFSKVLSLDGREVNTWNRYVVKLLVIIGAVFTLTESSFYFAFFVYLFNHNNNIAATVLQPSVVKHRNRTNAISMLGLFITWIIEIW